MTPAMTAWLPETRRQVTSAVKVADPGISAQNVPLGDSPEGPLEALNENAISGQSTTHDADANALADSGVMQDGRDLVRDDDVPAHEPEHLGPDDRRGIGAGHLGGDVEDAPSRAGSWCPSGCPCSTCRRP